MAGEIFIARQDTLEKEILPAAWIAEYKMHGEESYVFNDPAVWARLCMSAAAVNDPKISGEALEYVLTHPETCDFSAWLMQIGDLTEEERMVFAEITTAEQLAADAAAVAVVAESETAITAVMRSETAFNAFLLNEESLKGFLLDEKIFASVLENETSMRLIGGHEEAMNAIVNDTAGRTALEKSAYYTSCIQHNGVGAAKIVAFYGGLEPSEYADCDALAASETAMTAILGIDVGKSAVAKSAAMLRAICMLDTASDAYATVAQSYRSTLMSTLSQAPDLFTRSEEGLFVYSTKRTKGLNKNNIFFPTRMSSDVTTSVGFKVYWQDSGTTILTGTAAANATFSAGVSFRGASVSRSSGTDNCFVYCDVYTVIE